MSDEEDYNSEEDIDYVPTDGELGSEEENSGDEEDLSVLADDAGTVSSSKRTRKKKQTKNDLAPRKRKGGIKLEGDNATLAEDTNGDTGNLELAQQIKEEESARKKEQEKKRVDDLWSSFLSDVKPSPKPASKVPQTSSSSIKQADSSTTSSQNPCTTTATTSATAKPTSGKVTITKVFDFAGEEVKVTKEVEASSKEAQAELKKQSESEQQKTNTPTLSSSSSLSSSLSSSPLVTSTASASSLSPGSSLIGMKRPATGGAGLGSVLSKIGKKQKMGTLEKSKMDWDSFKRKEGIEEDLKTHNKGKDGYIERMSFLNRADVRQFEIERDLRLSKSGKR